MNRRADTWMRCGDGVDVEAEGARLRAERRWNDLATLLVAAYGPAVLAYLVTLSDYAEASDAFGQASEDLWRGLSGFEARCSFKTWFYTLARHALSRIRRCPAVRKNVPLSLASEQVERVHSATEPDRRPEATIEISEIRAGLAEGDRALLALRVDRQMSWGEIARVISGSEITCDTDAVRIKARLRKRFQLLKQTIRERATQLGLAEAWTSLE